LLKDELLFGHISQNTSPERRMSCIEVVGISERIISYIMFIQSLLIS